MGIEFNNIGSLYINTTDNTSILLTGGVSCVPEFEISADETPPVTFNLNKSASFSCDSSYFDTELLDKHFNMFTPKEFDLKYNRYIMIQARWHKKKRVNKKWLKRYGMKPDIVVVIHKASELTYLPNGEIEFDVNRSEYVLRADQRRKYLKIEW